MPRLRLAYWQLFREWDDDGSGTVSKTEFRRALPILGLQISKADADALFDSFDSDKGGTIDFTELSKQLKPKVSILPKVKSAPKLTAPPSFKGAEQYKEALAAELAAKRRLTRIQKQLVRAASMSALQEQKEKNRLEGLAVRQTMDKLIGRDVAARLANATPASDVEVKALASIFREKMIKLFAGASPSWMKLFTFVDEDRSGRISLGELKKMVRSHLMLSKEDLSEDRLRSLWRALDEDNSGFISAGEFGRFMKKGEEKNEGSTSALLARQKVAAQNLKSSAEMKSQLEQMSGQDVNKMLVTVTKASEDEVVAMAEQLTTKMASLFAGSDRAWIKLFKFMDDDNNGRISYDELKTMVRKMLLLSKADLPEARLLAVWKAIDADANGFLSVGEFGRLMRKGETLKAQQATSQETEDETARRRRVALEERAARQLAAKVAEDELQVAASREIAQRTRQLEMDAARLEAALKKGAVKGQELRGGGHSRTRIAPDTGDDDPAASRPVPKHPLLRPKKVGIGVDF